MDIQTIHYLGDIIAAGIRDGLENQGQRLARLDEYVMRAMEGILAKNESDYDPDDLAADALVQAKAMMDAVDKSVREEIENPPLKAGDELLNQSGEAAATVLDPTPETFKYQCSKCLRPVKDSEIINLGQGKPFAHHDICGRPVDEIPDDIGILPCEEEAELEPPPDFDQSMKDILNRMKSVFASMPGSRNKHPQVVGFQGIVKHAEENERWGEALENLLWAAYTAGREF